MEHWGRYLVDRRGSNLREKFILQKEQQQEQDQSRREEGEYEFHDMYDFHDMEEEERRFREVGKYLYIGYEQLLEKEQAIQHYVSAQRGYIWEREVMRRVDLETVAQGVNEQLLKEMN